MCSGLHFQAALGAASALHAPRCSKLRWSLAILLLLPQCDGLILGPGSAVHPRHGPQPVSGRRCGSGDSARCPAAATSQWWWGGCSCCVGLNLGEATGTLAGARAVQTLAGPAAGLAPPG